MTKDEYVVIRDTHVALTLRLSALLSAAGERGWELLDAYNVATRARDNAYRDLSWGDRDALSAEWIASVRELNATFPLSLEPATDG